MSTLDLIYLSGFLMSAIALSGGFLIFIDDKVLSSLLMPLVAFAAGSLLGGACFHMMPVALTTVKDIHLVFVLLVLGFVAFFFWSNLFIGIIAIV